MSGLLAAIAGSLAGSSDNKTPDAVNWADINSAVGFGVNANQTISGIVGSITLHFDVVVTDGSAKLLYDIDDGSGVEFNDDSTVAVSNGQTVSFRVEMVNANPTSGTVSIKNASDGMTELDSFAFSISNV